MGKVELFVFIVCFWSIMAIFSSIFDVTIGLNNVRDLSPDSVTPDKVESGYKKFVTGLFNAISDVPILSAFVPLFKIMSFAYTDEIPAILSIFLNIMTILSGFVCYLMIRGD